MKKDNNNRLNNADKLRIRYQNAYDKCINTAKEFNATGDRVMAEYNLQLAEHYFRLLKYDKQLAVNLKPEKNSESFEEAREPVEVCLQKKCSSNKTKDPSGPNKRRGSKSKEQPAAELDN